MHKKLFFVLGPFGLAVLGLAACESESGSSSSGTIAPFDGGGVDGLAPVDAPATDAPVDAPVVTPNVTVFVTKPDGTAEPNVDVVFHDAAGAVLAAVKTGADGKATSSGPAPAMATALLVSNQTDTEAVTWTAVQPGDELRVTSLASNLFENLGTYNITLTSPQTPVNFYSGYAGDCVGQRTNADAPLQIIVRRHCARPGNTNAILVNAYDGTGLIGSAFVKNLGAPNNNVVDVALGPFVAPTDLTLTKVNAPAQGGFIAELVEIVGTNGFSINSSAGFLGPDPVVLKVATGFSDAIQTVAVSQAGNSEVFVGKRWPANTTSFPIDLGQAPPHVTSATIDKTTTKRPKISWTTGGALTGFDGGVIRVAWSASDEAEHGWTFLVAPNATSAQVPVLPAAASKWEPPANATQIFGDPAVAFVDADVLVNEAGFRRDAGRALPFRLFTGIARRIVLPAANSTFRLTEWSPNNG